MSAQPAFELKTFPSTAAAVALYQRLQQCAAGPSAARRWWHSRRVRTTLTARQLQRRLQLKATPVLLRHVCLDLFPIVAASTRRVPHSH